MVCSSWAHVRVSTLDGAVEFEECRYRNVEIDRLRLKRMALREKRENQNALHFTQLLKNEE